MMTLMWLFALMITLQTPTAEYSPIPSDYLLANVLVLVRHGDRVQISREIGDGFQEVGNMRFISIIFSAVKFFFIRASTE